MAISGRTRVEVFTRDSFMCVYCGARPESQPLHVDHVIPKNEGGPDRRDNYVTACQRCNLGKGKRGLFPQGLSLTDLYGYGNLTVPVFKASVADLVRKPWLRMVVLLAHSFQSRWDPYIHGPQPCEEADLLEFDQQTRALIELMVDLCDATNGDAWSLETHLVDFASHIGWAPSFEEFRYQIRRYSETWREFYARQGTR